MPATAIQPPKYYMFIDESGDSSINNLGQFFLLGTVIIDQDDFQFIKGYFRLLKRNFFGDDFRNLHMTDIFERPSVNYPELIKPIDRTANFIAQLAGILNTIPFLTCIYRIDKNRIRSKYGYKPAKGRVPTFNADEAYESTAIESRMHKDTNFVRYFDNARKPHLPGGKANPDYKTIARSIPSLFISNKNASNVGLELSDIASYITYRKKHGDPQQRMVLKNTHVDTIFAAIRKSAHVGTPSSLVHDIKV